MSAWFLHKVDSFVFHGFSQGVLCISEVVVVYVVYADYASPQNVQRPDKVVIKFAGAAAEDLAFKSHAYETELLFLRGKTTDGHQLHTHQADLLSSPNVLGIFSNQDLTKLDEGGLIVPDEPDIEFCHITVTHATVNDSFHITTALFSHLRLWFLH
jgi:hypothetical protein